MEEKADKPEENVLLTTCPPELRDRIRGVADRALHGPKQRASAIRIKCLECCAWQIAEVRACEIKTCSLWALRGRG